MLDEVFNNITLNFGLQLQSFILTVRAYEIGITLMKLVKQIDYNFLANLDKIQKISLHQIANFSKVFCVACGTQLFFKV